MNIVVVLVQSLQPSTTSSDWCIFEVYRYVRDAIAREKEIKAWRREKKVALIEKTNPEWKDLSAEWED